MILRATTILKIAGCIRFKSGVGVDCFGGLTQLKCGLPDRGDTGVAWLDDRFLVANLHYSRLTFVRTGRSGCDETVTSRVF